MHIYNWTMTPSGGAITVDGQDESGEPIKLRHVKHVTYQKLTQTLPRRWWQAKARRVVQHVWCVAVDKDGVEHTLHIIR
jgi:hypothetical protein